MQSPLTFYCFHQDCKKSKTLFSNDSDHLIKNPRHRRTLKKIPDLLLNRYEFKECLGSGSFGAVFKVFDKIVKSNYALKVCLLELEGSPEVIEFETMARIKHANIIQLYEVHAEENSSIDEYIAIKLELAESDLSKVIDNEENQERLMDYSLQIFEGLNYLHNEHKGIDGKIHPVFHCYLKPENILLNDKTILISDFDTSQMINSSDKFKGSYGKLNIGFSLKYSAPEILKIYDDLKPAEEKKYRINDKVDIWSLGIILHLMFAKTHPFNENLENVRNNLITLDQELKKKNNVIFSIINGKIFEKNIY